MLSAPLSPSGPNITAQLDQPSVSKKPENSSYFSRVFSERNVSLAKFATTSVVLASFATALFLSGVQTFEEAVNHSTGRETVTFDFMSKNTSNVLLATAVLLHLGNQFRKILTTPQNS